MYTVELQLNYRKHHQRRFLNNFPNFCNQLFFVSSLFQELYGEILFGEIPARGIFTIFASFEQYTHFL